MAKHLLNIKLTTIPNGYALSVGSNEYLYFDLKSLLKGFMYHVGLEELGDTDKETIDSFIEASKVYCSDKGKAVKKIMKLEKENKSLVSSCNAMKKQIKSIEFRLMTAKQEATNEPTHE